MSYYYRLSLILRNAIGDANGYEQDDTKRETTAIISGAAVIMSHVSTICKQDV